MENLEDLTAKMRRLEAYNDDLKLIWLTGRYPEQHDRLPAARKHFGVRSRAVEMVEKTAIAAADTTTTGWASELIYPTLGREYTSALSSRTVIGKLPFRKAGLNTRTLKETVSGSATWVAQGAPVPVCRLTLDTTTLEISKVVALVLFTDEVFDNWTPTTAQNINVTLMKVVVRFLDQALLDPTFAAVVGKNPASLTNGITATTRTGNTEATITADIATMLQSLVDGGSDLGDVQLVMHPATALHMSKLLTAGGMRAYPDLGIRGGSLFGAPVLTTVGAIVSGSPTERLIAAIDATRCLLADDGVTTVEPSRTATVEMTDAPSGAAQHVSLFQTATTALRVSRYFNFERCHNSAVAYLQVNY